MFEKSITLQIHANETQIFKKSKKASWHRNKQDLFQFLIAESTMQFKKGLQPNIAGISLEKTFNESAVATKDTFALLLLKSK